MSFILNPEFFLNEFTNRGYEVENFNIVGWREKNSKPDQFNDTIAIYHKGENGKWLGDEWVATTLPGIPYLLKPINLDGTAIMVPGQYKDAYQLGLYKGYTCLRQLKYVKVFRDNDKDSAFDEKPESIEEGPFGIHIHRASLYNRVVGLSSAGCQVIKFREDFEELIKMCKESGRKRFTYTLVEL